MRPVKIIIYSIVLLLIVSIVISCTRKNLGKENGNRHFEISSWWTAEGENNALAVLQDTFSEEYPEHPIINSLMAGGSGTNARLILLDRLTDGTPPDVFQSLVGKGLIESSVKMGQVESLTFLYEEMNWTEAFDPVLLEAMSYKNELFSVPLNIHRANLIWFRPDVFKKLGITPPSSMDDLMAACEILAENGITPLALGDKFSWTSLLLYENILISLTGPEKYSDFWNGNISFWDEDIRTSLLYFLRCMDYSNSDHAALSWDEALWNVVQGNCGMTVIGDWADSNLTLKGLSRGEDYSWAAFPGTEGVYNWLADGFCLPKGAVRRDAALHWLRLCGSKEGQERFNFYKSSLPARTDTDRSQFSDYQLSAWKDYQTSTLVGSLSNGVPVSDKVWSILLEIMDDFVLHRNTDLCQEQLEEMRQSHLIN